jgi:hypothetical protein
MTKPLFKGCHTAKGKPSPHSSLSFQEATDPKPTTIRLTHQEAQFIKSLHRFGR